MRKVIFIAGTAFSGSSMLDMMLGNASSAFTTGELRFLFHPSKSFHINPPCGCGNLKCTFWQGIKKGGKRELYENIFKSDVQLRFIIDSSKDLFWMQEQQKILNRQGIESDILLIWKTPMEFAYSRYKRNMLKGWEKEWLEYHRLLLTLFGNFYAVQYRELSMNPSLKLRQICQALDIDYEEGMHNFWSKKHHILFGNISARYHTLNKEDKKYRQSVENLENVDRKDAKNLDNKHRKIYYDEKVFGALPETVTESAKDQRFKELSKAIGSHDVQHRNVSTAITGNRNLRLSPPQVFAFSMKRNLKNHWFQLKQKMRKSH